MLDRSLDYNCCPYHLPAQPNYLLLCHWRQLRPSAESSMKEISSKTSKHKLLFLVRRWQVAFTQHRTRIHGTALYCTANYHLTHAALLCPDDATCVVPSRRRTLYPIHHLQERCRGLFGLEVLLRLDFLVCNTIPFSDIAFVSVCERTRRNKAFAL